MRYFKYEKYTDYLDYLDLDHTCIKQYEDDVGGEEQTLRPLALSITVDSRIPMICTCQSARRSVCLVLQGNQGTLSLRQRRGI